MTKETATTTERRNLFRVRGTGLGLMAAGALSDAPIASTDPMSLKRQRFVEEYLVDLNATQAAVRAGYSARTAEQQGARLLGNVKVAAAIQAAQSARSQRVQITQDDVLRGLHLEATWTGDGSSHSARVAAWGLHAGASSENG